ncbi:MAG: 5-formyltetrahydrofolate cyclo-ligase [Candidatus Heteroscillospira sp.]|jgi:5-formyltetrahydrofolate cyclo-ligase
MDKKVLRAEVREKIRTMDPEYREKSDTGIFENLTALPEYKRAKTVFAYFSVNGEADTHRLISRAMDDGKRVALPVVLGDGQMVFALARGELVEGALYSIPEPDETSPRAEPEEGDLLIVPALCFDREGYRLGQGGGYYDRYLEKYDGVFTAGLCRERLLMDAVPRQPHDRRVCCVVTEKSAARP